MTKTDTLQSTQLAEKIWGHRFKDGQRGIEYTLEFLNVVSGTKYSFENKYYDRKKMEQFRTFVFEGFKEGAKSKTGASTVSFSEENKKKISDALGINLNDLEDLQHFFRNLRIQLATPSGKPSDRSWYASMLFPLHESLLFAELRTNKTNNAVSFERNFFARGGELYFLMIAQGTQKAPEMRMRIEQRLQSIMQQNKSITGVVDIIRESLEPYANEDTSNYAAPLVKDPSLANVIKGWEKTEYPMLPNSTKGLELFEDFASELDSLLKLNLDLFEMFHLMTSLICFQLHRYMLHQAANKEENEYYFFDCLEGQEAHVRRLAQGSFNTHERSIRECFDMHIEEQLNTIIPPGQEEKKYKSWVEKAKRSSGDTLVEKYAGFLEDIGFSKAHKPKKEALIATLTGESPKKCIRNLRSKMKQFSTDELTKKQLPILRTLARDGGFVVIGTGIRSRYVLSDEFLSILVYSALAGKEKMDFNEFVDVLYKKYKIVIGPNAAKVSGIYEREAINLKYFNTNEKKLRNKLKQNGLLHEYSDATALIKNPYFVRGGV